MAVTAAEKRRQLAAAKRDPKAAAKAERARLRAERKKLAMKGMKEQEREAHTSSPTSRSSRSRSASPPGARDHLQSRSEPVVQTLGQLSTETLGQLQTLSTAHVAKGRLRRGRRRKGRRGAGRGPEEPEEKGGALELQPVDLGTEPEPEPEIEPEPTREEEEAEEAAAAAAKIQAICRGRSVRSVLGAFDAALVAEQHALPRDGHPRAPWLSAAALRKRRARVALLGRPLGPPPPVIEAVHAKRREMGTIRHALQPRNEFFQLYKSTAVRPGKGLTAAEVRERERIHATRTVRRQRLRRTTLHESDSDSDSLPSLSDDDDTGSPSRSPSRTPASRPATEPSGHTPRGGYIKACERRRLLPLPVVKDVLFKPSGEAESPRAIAGAPVGELHKGGRHWNLQAALTNPRAGVVARTVDGLVAAGKRITSLDLSANGLDAGRAVALLDAMVGMSSLNRLDMSKNPFSEGRDGVALAFKSLLLDKACALRHLTLAGCKLGDRAVRCVAMAVGESSASLVDLDLSDNQIDSAAVAIAANVLGRPKSELTNLDLSWNRIGPKGAVALAERLAGRGPAYATPVWTLSKSAPKPRKPAGPKVRRHYDWSAVDVSDLVKEQETMRKVMMRAAHDDDGLDEHELKELMRMMKAQQLPASMVMEVKRLCSDGEVDENDRAVLLSLAPPEIEANEADVYQQLEAIEVTLIGLFRQYCYRVTGGRSGENADPNNVSGEQFKQFARDCGVMDGRDALDKASLDQIFLRAMFNRSKGAQGGSKGKAGDLDTAGGVNKAQVDDHQTLGGKGVDRALGLHEFVGGVVRLSNRRFPKLLGRGLAAKVRAMATVLESLCGIVDNAEELADSAPVRAILDTHKKPLLRIFNFYRQGDDSQDIAAQSAGAGKTMDIVEFEMFCTDAGICAPMPDKMTGELDNAPVEAEGGLQLPCSEPRTIFVALNLDDDLFVQEDKTNRADQIVLDEFYEGMGLLAQRLLAAKRPGASSTTTFPADKVAEEMQKMLKSIYPKLAAARPALKGLAKSVPADIDLSEHVDSTVEAVSSCAPLQILNAAWNNFENEGAGAIGNALLTNDILRKVNLAHNDVAVIGSVVLADGMRENKSVEELILDGNPIGEMGSRSIVAALRQLSEDRHISVLNTNMAAIDPDCLDLPAFDPGDPGGNYRLELLRPYDRAVANELLRLVRLADGFDEWRDVKLDGQVYVPSRMSLEDAIANEMLYPSVLDLFGEAGGLLEMTYYFEPRPAEECEVVSDLALARLKAMMGLTADGVPVASEATEEKRQHARDLWKGARTKLRVVGALATFKEATATASVNAKSNQQLRRLLDIASRELHFSTLQVIEMVQQFGTDRATRVDIVVELFPATVDKDALRDYCEGPAFNAEDLEKIIVGVGMEYSFDKINPTGHWRGNLDEEDDRNVMIQLINLSNAEKKERGDRELVDTSQHGMDDQSCFRNVLYNGKKVKRMFGRANPLPKEGVLEFDFVSRGVNGKCRSEQDQLPATLDAKQRKAFEKECAHLRREVDKSRAAGAAAVDRVQMVAWIRRWLKRCNGFLTAKDVVKGLHALGILPAFVLCKLCSQDGRDPGKVGLGAHGGKPPAMPRPISHAGVPCLHPSLCASCAEMIGDTPICCPVCTKWNDKAKTLEEVQQGTPKKGLQTAQAMMSSIRQTVRASPFTLPDGDAGWVDAGDREVAIEFVITVYSRCVELGALCTDIIAWFFNDHERHVLQQRLGCLNMINPMMPDGYWELNLKRSDEREVAHMLVLLAVGEPGENWRDEKFGDGGRKPRPFELPAPWLDEIPKEGLLQLHYYTSEKWVDPELRRELQRRCLVGEELTDGSWDDWKDDEDDDTRRELQL